MMRGRRAVLIATTLTLAVLSGGVAAATDAPADDFQSAAETRVLTDAGAAPDAGLAQTQPGGDLQAAAPNAGAQQALTLINQFRAQRGLQPWRAEGQLTGMAQTWATHLVTTVGAPATDPELDTPAKPLPGYPQGDYFLEYALYASGGNPSVNEFVEYIKSEDPDTLADPNVNQVGIGWSANGAGQVALYFIAVEYTFNDIGPSDTFYEPVEFLAFNEITTGYPDGGFRPTGKVTREAMAAFLYRFFEGGAIPTCDPAVARMFTDVTAGHPFCGAIEWLAGTGITTGYPDGTFKPGADVSREAMAAFLYRGLVDPVIPACAAGNRSFVDVSAGHPFCGAIEWLANEEISGGWSDGTFRPGLSVERQAMAAFLYRVATS